MSDDSYIPDADKVKAMEIDGDLGIFRVVVQYGYSEKIVKYF